MTIAKLSENSDIPEELKKIVITKCDDSIEILDFVYSSMKQIKKYVESDRLAAAKKLYFLATKLEKLIKS
ncbi:MAG: hypothetical protein N2258_01255 [Brevinematales bacterium]|nr:hypothetical protein [Brevinematales bacterium]